MLATLLATLATLAQTPAIPCYNHSAHRTADEMCQDFCTGKCAFLDTNDTGLPLTMSAYRVTPVHARDPANKNFGDPLGDVEFYFELRTGAGGRFLKSENVVGAFNVTVDGHWAAYKMCDPETHTMPWCPLHQMLRGLGRVWCRCNPLNQKVNTSMPHDNFVCEFGCMNPPNCKPLAQNKSAGHAVECTCPETGYDMRAVGREPAPNTIHKPSGLSPPAPPMPAGYLNCSERVYCAGCEHTSSKSMSYCMSCSAGHKSIVEACGGTDTPALQHACGWHDGITCLDLLQSLTTQCPRPTSDETFRQCMECAYDHVGSSTDWYAENCPARDIGLYSICSKWDPYPTAVIPGLWYHLPAAGQCQGAARPGDGSGCAWRATPFKFVNESCLNARFDQVIFDRNQACFDACPSHDDACWADCYYVGLAGNTTSQLPPVPLQQLQQIWEKGFQPPAVGGCPAVSLPEMQQTGPGRA